MLGFTHIFGMFMQSEDSEMPLRLATINEFRSTQPTGAEVNARAVCQVNDGFRVRLVDTLSDSSVQHLDGVGCTVKFRPYFGRAVMGAVNDGRIGTSVEQ